MKKLNLDISEIITLFNAGLSPRAIAKRMGCSVIAIRTRLKALGYSRSREEALKLRRGERRYLRQLDLEAIKRLYLDERKTCKEIAIIFGCNTETIATRVKDMGIMRSQADVMRLLRAGAKHPCWKGGVRIVHGYRYIRIGLKLYRPEHIIIWEQTYRKKLPKNWVVHHLNGIKDDNRPENLVAYPKGRHDAVTRHEPYKCRIRKLEAKVKMLEGTLRDSQLIWMTKDDATD